MKKNTYSFFSLTGKRLLFLLLFIGINLNVIGATINTKTNGNWGTNGTWSGLGLGCLALLAGNVPAATDNAVICGGLTVNVNGNFSITNVTVDGDLIINTGQTLTVSGSLTIGAGGSVTINGTGQILVAGNWTNNGGTFTPNTATVTFNGTGAQAINGSAAAQTFYNVVVSKTAGTLLSVGGSTTTLTTNNFTETTGNFTAPATMNITSTATAALTISAGTYTAGANTNIKGNWTNNSTFTHSSGTVTFNGASGQTIGGTTSTTFYNLTISNASAAGVTLNTNQTVNNTLTLGGLLFLGNFNLTFGASATAVAGGPNTTKMVVCSGSGAVKKLYTANGSFVFPIGDNTVTNEYSPITLNFTSGTYAGGAYASVRVINAQHPNNANTTEYINRYWSVATSGITTPVYTMDATYLTADIVGTEANIITGKYTGSLPWVKYTAVNAASNLLNAVGVTNASADFTGISNTLPTIAITGGGVTICNGSSVSLGAVVTRDAPYTYAWVGSNLSSTTSASPSASPTTGATPTTYTYTVTLTDGNGFLSTTASTTITVNPTPTLTGASQAAIICEGNSAVINLTGLLAGSTSTVDYTINGVAQTAITGVVADGSGAASFNTAVLTAANNGQTLRITGITCTSLTPNCPQAFARNVTLTVNALPIAIAGGSQTIFADASAIVSGASASNGTILWTHNGAGTLTDETTLTPTYTAADADFGQTVILTLTVTSTNVCAPATATATYTVFVSGEPALYSYQCGTILPYVDEYVYAYAFPGATQYRFRMTSDGGATYQTFTTPASVFYIPQFTTYAYNTTYTFDVAVFVAGAWTPYGPDCNLTTPAVPPLTQVKASQCGSTLPTIDSQIAADPVWLAEQYRFRVSDGVTVQIFDSPNQVFYLTQLGSYLYGTTYTIQVAVKYLGVWKPYGPACTVASPGILATKIIPSQCGITLTNINTDLYADEIVGATQYRFRVTDGVTIQTIDKPSRTFKLTHLPSVAYSTAYLIDVSAFYGGAWQPYGLVCSVTTPGSTLNTKIQASQCGITLTNIFTDLYADEVAGATQYRFRVTNGANVQTIDKPTKTFKLSHLPAVFYGAVNIIDVAIFYNGTWQPYGPACNVTTPALPLTKIQASQCGLILTTNATYIVADEVPGVAQYRFRLTNDGGANYTYVDRSSRVFSFAQLPSYALSSTYTIDVAVNYNSIWQPYGATCNITTPAVPGMGTPDPGGPETTSLLPDATQSDESVLLTNKVEKEIIAATAFPNPFGNSFVIEMQTLSKEPILITVYDIIGKYVETIEVRSSDIRNVQMGETYAPGIYYIALKQAENIKMLKVVKAK